MELATRTAPGQPKDEGRRDKVQVEVAEGPSDQTTPGR